MFDISPRSERSPNDRGGAADIQSEPTEVVSEPELGAAEKLKATPVVDSSNQQQSQTSNGNLQSAPVSSASDISTLPPRKLTFKIWLTFSVNDISVNDILNAQQIVNAIKVVTPLKI